MLSSNYEELTTPFKILAKDMVVLSAIVLSSLHFGVVISF